MSAASRDAHAEVQEIALDERETNTPRPNSNSPSRNRLADADARFDNIEANIAYNLTPQVQFVGAYAYTIGKVHPTDFAPQYHQVDVGVNYFVSHRTILYLAGIYQRAAGDATYANIECAGSSCAASSSRNQVSALAGIFHMF